MAAAGVEGACAGRRTAVESDGSSADGAGRVEVVGAGRRTEEAWAARRWRLVRPETLRIIGTPRRRSMSSPATPSRKREDVSRARVGRSPSDVINWQQTETER